MPPFLLPDPFSSSLPFVPTSLLPSIFYAAKLSFSSHAKKHIAFLRAITLLLPRTPRFHLASLLFSFPGTPHPHPTSHSSTTMSSPDPPAPASEDPKASIREMQEAPLRYGYAFSEAAALLVVWSILVMNEGALRWIFLAPFGADDGNPLTPDVSFSDPVRGPFGGGVRLGALFFASLAEVTFGLVGLALGVSAFVFRYYNSIYAKTSLAIQSALGWFVFIVYVFAVPAQRAANLLPLGTFNGISLSLHRFLITLGMFTSFHFCLALQGGQFVFMARIIANATNTDFLMQKSGERMRAVFWNGNLALAGLWTFLTGCIVAANSDGATIPRTAGLVYRFAPNVGRSPALSIFTGLLMMIWGIYGMLIPLMKLSGGTPYYLGSGLVYFMVYLNFVLVQFGLVANENKFFAGLSMHNGLVFMLHFLPTYFVYRYEQEQRAHATVQ